MWRHIFAYIVFRRYYVMQCVLRASHISLVSHLPPVLVYGTLITLSLGVIVSRVFRNSNSKYKISVIESTLV